MVLPSRLQQSSAWILDSNLSMVSWGKYYFDAPGDLLINPTSIFLLVLTSSFWLKCRKGVPSTDPDNTWTKGRGTVSHYSSELQQQNYISFLYWEKTYEKAISFLTFLPNCDYYDSNKKLLAPYSIMRIKWWMRALENIYLLCLRIRELWPTHW